MNRNLQREKTSLALLRKVNDENTLVSNYLHRAPVLHQLHDRHDSAKQLTRKTYPCGSICSAEKAQEAVRKRAGSHKANSVGQLAQAVGEGC